MSWWQWVGIGTIAFPIICGGVLAYLARAMRKRNTFRHDPCWASRNLRGANHK